MNGLRRVLGPAAALPLLVSVADDHPHKHLADIAQRETGKAEKAIHRKI
jgi:hypothetical protein